MTPIVNLHILAKRFSELSRSAYFDSAFKDFAERTAKAIAHVIDNPNQYPDDVIRQFEAHVWRVMQFVSGSRTNDAPHETQYVLRKALKHWLNKDVLVSSASLEDLNFFLNTEDLWEFIELALSKFDAEGYKPLFVRIGSPLAYKHKPVFCVPLFHELGHFVDHYYEITKSSLLLHAPGPIPPGATINQQQWQFVNHRHRMEHFADIFAACYCGEASKKSLQAIAPNNPDSPTHPSTAKRITLIDTFLNGNTDSMIDLLQNATNARTQQILSRKFLTPDINAAFDNVLTYKISNEAELFGIFPASWEYLFKQIDNRTAQWIDNNITTHGIELTINDLTEKTIRNFEVTERWSNVSSH